MSEENEEESQPLPFRFIQLGSPSPEQIEQAKKQRIEVHRHVIAFAKAGLSHVADATKSMRELQALYEDAPATGLGEMSGRVRNIRDILALIREELEWWADR